MDVFSKLASELSQKERQEFLAGLISDGSKAIEEASEYHISYLSPQPIQEEIENLSFWEKIFIFFDRLFSRKKTEEIVQTKLLNRLAKKLYAKNKAITKERIYLTPIMKQAIEELISVAKFFNVPLSAQKGEIHAFYAFLARITLIDHYAYLEQNLDPDLIAKKIDDYSEKSIRQELDLMFERLMQNIDLRQKEIMNENTQVLYLLKLFCQIRLDLFLNSFNMGVEKNCCEIGIAGKYLTELCSILYSLNFSGDSSLFEALYLFPYFVDGRMNHISRSEMDSWISKAYEMLSLLGDIVQRLSLRDITACCTGNYSYKPELAGGGDEWFSSYKRYWKIYANGKLAEFNTKMACKKQLEICNEFFKMDNFPWMKYFGIAWREKYHEFPFSGALLSLCLQIGKMIKEKMAYNLKIIIGEGLFYKKQNHEEFAEAFELVEETSARIQAIEEKAREFLRASHRSRQDEIEMEEDSNPPERKEDSPNSTSSAESEEKTGDKPSVVVPDEAGNSSEKEKERIFSPDFIMRTKIETEKDFAKIVDPTVNDFHVSLTTLYNVLDGILYGEVGGRFDTVSNLAYLGGGRSKIFIANIKQNLVDLQKMEELLKGLRKFEMAMNHR